MATLDSDNFNRTFVTLAGETSSGGFVWSKNSTYTGVISSANSNTEMSGSGTLDFAWHYSGATSSGADYDISLTVSNLAAGNVSIGIVGRQITSADTGEWLFYHGGNTRYELRERSAGSSSTLATDNTTASPISNAKVMKQSFSGTQLTCTYDGATLFGGAVTVGLSTAGRAGVASGDNLTSRGDSFLWEEASGSSAAATSNGAAVATGTGASRAAVPASSIGASTATMVGAAADSAAANSTGTAVGTMTGAASDTAAASSTGIAVGTMVGAASDSAAMNAAGASTGMMVGQSSGTSNAAASSAGTSTATATGKSSTTAAMSSAGRSVATMTGHATGGRTAVTGGWKPRKTLTLPKRVRAQDDQDLTLIAMTLAKWLEAA